MDKIITIGREFGSGGHEIGMKLAEMLNIPFYDKELLKKVSDMGGLHESFLETHEEKAPQLLSASFERSLIDTYYQPTLSDTIFLEQSKVIKQIASEGPCVIVGRCSDYVLRDSNVFTVFVCASMEHKISRKYAVAPEKADYTDAQMEKYIKPARSRSPLDGPALTDEPQNIRLVDSLLQGLPGGKTKLLFTYVLNKPWKP